MKKTIVIAEDNELMRKLLTYRLEIDGYVVRDFANGKGAADYMLENQFDLLITDLVMPVMDGFELIQIVRNSISKTIPIMVISGDCDADFKFKVLEMGVDIYVTKPVTAVELSVHLKHLIYNKKQREDGND